jgi:hypothetical protein
VASLAANVAVAEPTTIGRVIAAWPSFTLIGSYEMLMRQVRRTASASTRLAQKAAPRPTRQEPATDAPAVLRQRGRQGSDDVRRQAWQWALANRSADGSLPSGKVIAERYGRHERWGRLVKTAGVAGEFVDATAL